MTGGEILSNYTRKFGVKPVITFTRATSEAGPNVTGFALTRLEVKINTPHYTLETPTNIELGLISTIAGFLTPTLEQTLKIKPGYGKEYIQKSAKLAQDEWERDDPFSLLLIKNKSESHVSEEAGLLEKIQSYVQGATESAKSFLKLNIRGIAGIIDVDPEAIKASIDNPEMPVANSLECGHVVARIIPRGSETEEASEEILGALLCYGVALNKLGAKLGSSLNLESSASSSSGLFSKAEYITRRGPQIKAAENIGWEKQEELVNGEYTKFDIDFTNYLDMNVSVSTNAEDTEVAGAGTVITCEFG